MRRCPRAFRRWQKERRKRWCRRVRGPQGWPNPERLADTPTPCSCWMCGNPRKYFKERTRQERMAEVALSEGVMDIPPRNGGPPDRPPGAPERTT